MNRNRFQGGYSILEVLLATAVMMFAVSALGTNAARYYYAKKRADSYGNYSEFEEALRSHLGKRLVRLTRDPSRLDCNRPGKSLTAFYASPPTYDEQQIDFEGWSFGFRMEDGTGWPTKLLAELDQHDQGLKARARCIDVLKSNRANPDRLNFCLRIVPTLIGSQRHHHPMIAEVRFDFVNLATNTMIDCRSYQQAVGHQAGGGVSPAARAYYRVYWLGKGNEAGGYFARSSWVVSDPLGTDY